MLYGTLGLRSDIYELLIAVQSLQHLHMGLSVVAQQKREIRVS